MSFQNCKKYLIETIIPLSILLICLFQLYFQYSTMVTPRPKDLDDIDKRNTIRSFQMGDKKFDFNIPKIDEYFNDSPLININIIKNQVFSIFNKINPEKENNEYTLAKYKLYYLLGHDIIFIIIIYMFVYSVFKAGIIKLIFQILRFYFIHRRLKKSNPNISICQAIRNYFDNKKLRNEDIFSPEGFEYFDYLCNIVIIFDLIWLYILYKKQKLKQKPKVELTDSDRVDYQNNESDQNKNCSENNNENEGDAMVLRENNNNIINNKDDEESDKDEEKNNNNSNNNNILSESNNNNENNNINNNNDKEEIMLTNDREDDDNKINEENNQNNQNINNNEDNQEEDEDDDYNPETK